MTVMLDLLARTFKARPTQAHMALVKTFAGSPIVADRRVKHRLYGAEILLDMAVFPCNHMM